MITSGSAVQSRAILRSFLCSNNDVVLFAYPSGGMMDQSTNAFEWMFSVNTEKNGWTVNSSHAVVNVREITEFVFHLSSYWGKVMRQGSAMTAVNGKTLTQCDASLEKQSLEGSDRARAVQQDEEKMPHGELIVFNIDLKELVHAMEVVNVCISPITLQLTSELQLVTPSVSIINSQGEERELNLILKDFHLMNEAQRVLEVKDILMAVDFDSYSVHCSTDSCTVHLDATTVFFTTLPDL